MRAKASVDGLSDTRRPSEPSRRQVTVSDANEAGSWEGILEPGEVMEWQGAPVRGLRWELTNRTSLAFVFLGAAGVTLYGITRDPQLHSVGEALLKFAAWAVILALGYHAYSFWNRRRTFYSLTNRHAFIATWHFGVQTLKAYPLPDPTDLRLIQTTPGHVMFAKDWVLRRSWLDREQELQQVDVGFRDIADPRQVYELMLKQQASGE